MKVISFCKNQTIKYNDFKKNYVFKIKNLLNRSMLSN